MFAPLTPLPNSMRGFIEFVESWLMLASEYGYVSDTSDTKSSISEIVIISVRFSSRRLSPFESLKSIENKIDESKEGLKHWPVTP